MSKYRSQQSGHVWAISGGAPNQPLVCLICDVFYSLPNDLVGTWDGHILQPQVLTPRKIWFAARGHRDLLRYLEADKELLSAGMRGQGQRRPLRPRGILIDDSQSPSAPGLFAPLQVAGVQVWNYRLTAGDHDPLSFNHARADNGSNLVGARWLTSWFRNVVAGVGTTQKLHGLPYSPGQTIVSFAEFEDQESPGMAVDQIKSAMAAADRLVKPSRTKATDADAILDLSADEVVSATVMLALLAAEQLRPVSEYQGHGNIDGGWGADTSNYRAPHVY
jgi:hypothetical protein